VLAPPHYMMTVYVTRVMWWIMHPIHCVHHASPPCFARARTCHGHFRDDPDLAVDSHRLLHQVIANVYILSDGPIFITSIVSSSQCAFFRSSLCLNSLELQCHKRLTHSASSLCSASPNHLQTHFLITELTGSNNINSLSTRTQTVVNHGCYKQ